MESLQHLLNQENRTLLLSLLIVIVIWDAIWKLIALWKASRNNHLAWFICIALINTLGVLPIIYILMNKKND